MSQCSIKYLAVPNNSHLRHCACVISQSLAQVFIYLIFISSVTVRFMIKVRVSGLGLVVGLGLG